MSRRQWFGNSLIIKIKFLANLRPGTYHLASNQVVGGSNPSGRANLSRSIPDTSVTVYTEDMGNTLASKGLGAHSTRLDW